MSLLKFTIASIKMFYRDGRSIFFSLFLPILFMTIFGIADFGKFANTKIGIIDNTNTDQSTQIIDAMKKISIIDIKTGDSAQLKNDLQKGNLDLVIELPKDLIQSKMVNIDIPGLQLPANVPLPQKPEFQSTEITAYINDGRAQQGQGALTVVKQVFSQLDYKLSGTQEIFSFKQVNISSNNLSYLDFLIPGIISLSIMQMSLFSIIFTIVGFREKGIMKRLQTTPMKSFDFIFSQVVTRLTISLIQVAILIIIATVFFHIKIIGSYAIIALLAMIGAIVFLTLGLLLSNVAKNQDAVPPVANIVMLPMMFLGNVFFPIETMPTWLQHTVKYLPLNYLSDAMRNVMINNAHIVDISKDIYGLLIWMIVLVIIASLSFRWKSED